LAVVAVGGTFPARPVGKNMDLIMQLGTEMLGDSMLIFETAGIALLATMLGAVILSSRSSRFGSFSDTGSHPPPLDPDDPDSVPDIKAEEEESGHHHHSG
ncbi:MAG: NADH-quinone oxidoreductase subunit J, partial [Thermodesulfobacteriota bacterium]